MIFGAQFACLMFTCLAAAACTSAQMEAPVPTSADIVARMAQAQAENRDRVQPYIVTRDYKVFGQENAVESKSHVITAITVVPPNSKK